MVEAASKSGVAGSLRTKTVAYDISEQLRTPAEMAAYLDAWFEEAPEDASGIARALGDIARAKGKLVRRHGSARNLTGRSADARRWPLTLCRAS
ncbi:MAG: transcriptional regulator [Betaproteobacteria bacterium]